MRVTTHRIGWHTLLLQFGSLVHCHVPVHEDCARRLRADRWFRWGRIVLGIAVAGATFRPLSDLLGAEDPARVWLLGWLILGLMPGVVLDTWRPPPFDLTATKDAVEYEFRRRDHANAFAACNSPKDPGG